jgi:hypothetical protein
MQVTIGELSSAEVPSFCALFHTVFGASVTPRQWAWKYTQGPRLGSVNIVARDHQGNIVGHAGASVFPGICTQSSLAMAQVCDVMVSKNLRGGFEASGVYHRLMQALQNTLHQSFTNPYAYGFAGVRPFKLGQRMGFYRESHLCRPGYLHHLPPHKVPRLWSVQAAHWDAQRLDRLWAPYAKSISLPTVSRTGAFLQWRYASHPNNTYKLWVVRHLLQDKGWFITRTLPNDEVCVIDALLPDHAHAPTLTAALDAALTRVQGRALPIFAWNLQTPQSTLVEPVVGGEVKVAQWHTQLPHPAFHPGDTDVF